MMLENYRPVVLANPFDLRVDRLLDDALHAAERMSASKLPHNVYENNTEFGVQLALPGIEAKDVEITVKDGVLTVETMLSDSAPDIDNKQYYVRQLKWEAISRSFTLPTSVNHAKASAKFKDGVLTITFPKLEEAKPRRILIDVT